MARKRNAAVAEKVAALARVLDRFEGRYVELAGASDFGSYIAARPRTADEEILTEPMLATIIEDVLGFGPGDYFPQLGKSGLKPDFTPRDLVTHRFVLDAKGSTESLSAHVAQIRRYVDQRALRHGVLFNGKQLRVYPSGSTQYDKALSFDLVPLWRAARGEQLPVGPDFEAFDRFLASFSHRSLSTADKIERIRSEESWAERLADATVDVDYLVDQLRRLARALADDAGAYTNDLVAYVDVSPDRLERLNDELRMIALDIEPGVDLASLPTTIAEWSDGAGTVERVWRQYLLRVAYLSVTRILLYRSWEDVGFVDEMLYDGGFDTAYERMNENVREVLRRAFLLGSDKYKTLFSAENNYEWYRPSEDVLVDVLYNLGAIPLGKLDQDALGELYVSYVDEIDRDRLGQFFTPRDVVRFMLDRAGFVGEKVFRVEGDERLPRRVFDFATGSGGFLVEAGRRVIEDSGIADDDSEGLREALRAISAGFYGGEISPFPYYLTEINLLLQVSRLLGRMRVVGVEPPPFVLGVMRIDSLETKSSLDVEAETRAANAVVPAHDIYDVLPLEPEKHAKLRDLHRDGEFDLVIGNPPYVAEANNRPLFQHFRSLVQWRDVYKGKTDYLYYFLLLAVDKLKPGGKLCVITPAGWMNAGNADFLRERLAAELTLEELFLFGSYKLFAADQGPAPTPTIESAILVATQGRAPKGHKLRVVVLEAAPPNVIRAELLAEMARRSDSRGGRRGGILVHSLPQANLEAAYPWPVKYESSGVHMQTVSKLKSALADPSALVEELRVSWSVFTGVETAADAYTARIRRTLPAETRRYLDAAGAEIGSPIMELPREVAATRPWSEHETILARSPEPTGILYGAVDELDSVAYLLLERGTRPPRPILEALEPWKPLLENRAEIRRNDREWWETAWPRNRDELDSPKVMALWRTDRGRFALDESGAWRPGKKVTVAVHRTAGSNAPVAYLCGLLNSELLDLWYAVRGKTPRDVWRNYEPKRMNEMPYRRPEGDPRAEEIAGLVREIAANRRTLLLHRAVVRDLGRTVKDPWKSGPVVVDRAALVGELPARAKISVRLDPALSVEGRPAGKSRRESPTVLVFTRGREETGRLSGDEARLDLLIEVIEAGSIDDVRTALLPKDLGPLEHLAAERVSIVAELLAEGLTKVERVERLVCALYGLPDDLTEAVVQHAVDRASR